jgi:sarcosine oxidase subunit delta
MLIITCPHCGARDHSEFTYNGDAGRKRPDDRIGDGEAWYDYVFTRPNPRGPMKEYWHHVQGCRQWLIVERDTLTHEILSVTPARDDPQSDGPPNRGGEGG